MLAELWLSAGRKSRKRWVLGKNGGLTPHPKACWNGNMDSALPVFQKEKRIWFFKKKLEPDLQYVLFLQISWQPISKFLNTLWANNVQDKLYVYGWMTWLIASVYLLSRGSLLKLYIGEHQGSTTVTYMVYYSIYKILSLQLNCRQPAKKKQAIYFFMF